MTYTVINHKEVKNDVLQAKEWYKSQQKGLEKHFTDEVKNTLHYLIKNPLLFQVKYKNVRTAFTAIFPYGVHYHLNQKSKTITVLGVFHTSISPDKWLKRL
jgi:ParE toxin of type II toxin-antitoxin system, parDE